MRFQHEDIREFHLSKDFSGISVNSLQANCSSKGLEKWSKEGQRKGIEEAKKRQKRGKKEIKKEARKRQREAEKRQQRDKKGQEEAQGFSYENGAHLVDGPQKIEKNPWKRGK